MKEVYKTLYNIKKDLEEIEEKMGDMQGNYYQYEQVVSMLSMCTSLKNSIARTNNFIVVEEDTLAVELAEAIEELAEKTGRPVDELIEQAIKMYDKDKPRNKIDDFNTLFRSW